MNTQEKQKKKTRSKKKQVSLFESPGSSAWVETKLRGKKERKNPPPRPLLPLPLSSPPPPPLPPPRPKVPNKPSDAVPVVRDVKAPNLSPPAPQNLTAPLPERPSRVRYRAEGSCPWRNHHKTPSKQQKINLSARSPLRGALTTFRCSSQQIPEPWRKKPSTPNFRHLSRPIGCCSLERV